MKSLRKIMALLIAMVMVLGMSVSVFAAEGETAKTITLTGGKAGHTYTAYQIFTGKVEGKELKDIQWGADVTESYKATADTAAAAAKIISDSNDAHTMAVNLVTNNYLNSTNAAKVTLTKDGTVTISGLATGYYVIVDSTSETITTENDVYSEYVVELVGDVNGKLKSDIPTVEKKVNDNDNEWNDAGDFSIGDTVPYKLTGTIADNFNNYETYKYIFHDVLSKGQAFQKDSLKVTINGDETKNITNSFTITPETNSDGKTTTEITISCANLNNIQNLTKDDKIIVTYNAILTADAAIGLPGNNNTVYLEFSNNPEDNGEGTSKTKEDEVLVFTYELDTTKTDASTNAALKDAKFVLKNKDGKFAKLDNDKKVSAWVDTQNDATELISGTDGKFVVIGLDAGDYILVETEAPSGYNKIEGEIAVKITATQKNLDDYKEVAEADDPSEILTAVGSEVTIPGHEKVTSEGDTNTGIVPAGITNASGSTLPSTGGMGTTLFYIVGGILVAGAAIILIAKRKVNA